MGRPREFDLDERLDLALRVFWRHGYEGAALSDLTEAMGISRPSLYAAYGNKESLFRKVVDHYLAGPASHLRDAAGEATGRAAVERLLRGAVAVVTARDHRGCLVIQGALATGKQADPARAELVARRRAATDRLRERLERARVDGELGADVDTAALAGFVTTVSYGLSVQATDGATPEELHAVVDVAMSAWPG
ncbi:MAG TPA: TetR/AcrR family transcriptional regulator [Actinophytocola sp.]|nr:TetR/AcrR family transcriptional regulator [Actinophytocola sp.]